MALLADRRFFTRRPRLLARATIAREEPIIDIAGRSTAASSTPTRTSTTTTRASSGTSSAARSTTGCVAANYVESLGAKRERRRRRWSTRATQRHGRRRVTIRSRVLVNACGPFVDALNAPPRWQTAHRHVLLEGRPSHRRPADAQPARAHLLRRRRAALLRHPHGPAHLHRHDRHARREPASRTSPTRTAASSSTTSTSGCGCPRPLTETDIIAERCGVRPLAVAGDSGGRKTADWMQLSRKHVVEVDGATAPPQHLRRQADRLPQRRRRGRGPRARARRRDAVPGGALVRRAAGRRAGRVLAPGAAHEPRRADVSAVVGDADAAALAPLRRPGVRPARGHPARPAAWPRCSSRTRSTCAARSSWRRATR